MWTSFNLEVVTHLEDPGKKIRVFLYNTTRDRVELAITSDQLLKNQDLWEGMEVNTRELLYIEPCNYLKHGGTSYL